MKTRNELKKELSARLSYAIHSCMENNQLEKIIIYQGQLDNLELYLDEYIAKRANLVIDMAWYLPSEMVGLAGQPLDMTYEEIKMLTEKDSSESEKKFIDLINDNYGINMPYKEDYQNANITAHRNPNMENWMNFALLQRNNGDFITLGGQTLLSLGNDELYVKNQMSKRHKL